MVNAMKAGTMVPRHKRKAIEIGFIMTCFDLLDILCMYSKKNKHSNVQCSMFNDANVRSDPSLTLSTCNSS